MGYSYASRLFEEGVETHSRGAVFPVPFKIRYSCLQQWLVATSIREQGLRPGRVNISECKHCQPLLMVQDAPRCGPC